MEEQVTCDNCQEIFTPKWKRREGLRADEEYAVCPHCNAENAFQVTEEDDYIDEDIGKE